MNKVRKWFRRSWIRQRWLCLTKQCDYFNHYLAYGPPDLAHEGYHAASRQCEYWQKRDMDWMAEHPDALKSPFVAICENWEKRVRA